MHHTQHHWVNAKHIWNNQGYFYAKHLKQSKGVQWHILWYCSEPIAASRIRFRDNCPTIIKDFPQKKIMEMFKHFIESWQHCWGNSFEKYFGGNWGWYWIQDGRPLLPPGRIATLLKGLFAKLLITMLFGANFLTWQIWQIAKSFNGWFVVGIKKVFRPHLVVCWLVTPDKMWLSRIRPKLSN